MVELIPPQEYVGQEPLRVIDELLQFQGDQPPTFALLLPATPPGERGTLVLGGAVLDIAAIHGQSVTLGVPAHKLAKWLALPSSDAAARDHEHPWAWNGFAVGVALALWVLGCFAHAVYRGRSLSASMDGQAVARQVLETQLERNLVSIPVAEDSPVYEQYHRYYLNEYQRLVAQSEATISVKDSGLSSFGLRVDWQVFCEGLSGGACVLLVGAALLTVAKLGTAITGSGLCHHANALLAKLRELTEPRGMRSAPKPASAALPATDAPAAAAGPRSGEGAARAAVGAAAEAAAGGGDAEGERHAGAAAAPEARAEVCGLQREAPGPLTFPLSPLLQVASPSREPLPPLATAGPPTGMQKQGLPLLVEGPNGEPMVVTLPLPPGRSPTEAAERPTPQPRIDYGASPQRQKLQRKIAARERGRQQRPPATGGEGAPSPESPSSESAAVAKPELACGDGDPLGDETAVEALLRELEGTPKASKKKRHALQRQPTQGQRNPKHPSAQSPSSPPKLAPLGAAAPATATGAEPGDESTAAAAAAGRGASAGTPGMDMGTSGSEVKEASIDPPLGTEMTPLSAAAHKVAGATGTSAGTTGVRPKHRAQAAPPPEATALKALQSSATPVRKPKAATLLSAPPPPAATATPAAPVTEGVAPGPDLPTRPGAAATAAAATALAAARQALAPTAPAAGGGGGTCGGSSTPAPTPAPAQTAQAPTVTGPPSPEPEPQASAEPEAGGGNWDIALSRSAKRRTRTAAEGGGLAGAPPAPPAPAMGAAAVAPAASSPSGGVGPPVAGPSAVPAAGVEARTQGRDHMRLVPPPPPKVKGAGTTQTEASPVRVGPAPTQAPATAAAAAAPPVLVDKAAGVAAPCGAGAAEAVLEELRQMSKDELLRWFNANSALGWLSDRLSGAQIMECTPKSVLLNHAEMLLTGAEQQQQTSQPVAQEQEPAPPLAADGPSPVPEGAWQPPLPPPPPKGKPSEGACVTAAAATVTAATAALGRQESDEGQEVGMPGAGGTAVEPTNAIDVLAVAAAASWPPQVPAAAAAAAAMARASPTSLAGPPPLLPPGVGASIAPEAAAIRFGDFDERPPAPPPAGPPPVAPPPRAPLAPAQALVAGAPPSPPPLLPAASATWPGTADAAPAAPRKAQGALPKPSPEGGRPEAEPVGQEAEEQAASLVEAAMQQPIVVMQPALAARSVALVQSMPGMAPLPLGGYVAGVQGQQNPAVQSPQHLQDSQAAAQHCAQLVQGDVPGVPEVLSFQNMMGQQATVLGKQPVVQFLPVMPAMPGAPGMALTGQQAMQLPGQHFLPVMFAVPCNPASSDGHTGTGGLQGMMVQMAAGGEYGGMVQTIACMPQTAPLPGGNGIRAVPVGPQQALTAMGGVHCLPFPASGLGTGGSRGPAAPVPAGEAGQGPLPSPG